MYELIIEKCGESSEKLSFKTFTERDDYIMNHWDDAWDWLVPCVWGGWIDVRDYR